MDKKSLAQYRLADGTEVLVEIPRPQASGQLQEISKGQLCQKVIDIAEGAQGSFESAIDQVIPVAETVITRLKSGLTSPPRKSK